MSYGTAETAWQESLRESVDALAAAARELQLAHRSVHTQLALADAGSDRLRLQEGVVRVRREGGTDGRRSPHGHAVTAIDRVLRDAEQHLHATFEEAALAYADGVTWALRRVVEGDRPVRVTLETYSLGAYVMRWTDECPALSGCPEPVQAAYADAVADAYDEMLTRYLASVDAEQLAGADKVEDWEAAEMHRQIAAAQFLPDAAVVYADLVRRALDHLLTQPSAAGGAR